MLLVGDHEEVHWPRIGKLCVDGMIKRSTNQPELANGSGKRQDWWWEPENYTS